MKTLSKKSLLIMLLLAAFSLQSAAQSSTVSPYSQFGLGHLSEQMGGMTRGMNGLGIAMREHNQINPTNPASNSAIDSLTFIFDIGISGQLTNFEQGAKKLNANTASLDYIIAGLRLKKNLGLSFGILPYSNVGYNYTESGNIGETVSSSSKYTQTFSATEGGLHQYFVGLGWKPLKFLSVGMNAGYLSGNIERNVTLTYSDANIDSYGKTYSTTVNSYKLDFGMQAEIPVSKKDVVTVGLTYGLGHKLGADLDMDFTRTNASTSTTSTTNYKADNAFELPNTIGAGLSWQHNNKWKVGADFSLQKWGSISYPEFAEKADGSGFEFKMSPNYYKDSQKITLGGEYCQNEDGRKFMQRVHYRAGMSYATPYFKLGNADGPKEISISAGFGIPVINNRSFLNVSAQWVNAQATGFIKENTFRINIGLTFNERWFMKWKLE